MVTLGEVMKKFLQRLLCSHEWSIDEKEVESYCGWDGYKVRVFECECKKCGKRKRREYY